MQKRTSLDAIVYELRDGKRTLETYAVPDRRALNKGEVTAAKAWLTQIASQLGTAPPEIPGPLRGVRVTRVSSDASPEGWRPQPD